MSGSGTGGRKTSLEERGIQMFQMQVEERRRGEQDGYRLALTHVAAGMGLDVDAVKERARAGEKRVALQIALRDAGVEENIEDIHRRA